MARLTEAQLAELAARRLPPPAAPIDEEMVRRYVSGEASPYEIETIRDVVSSDPKAAQLVSDRDEDVRLMLIGPILRLRHLAPTGVGDASREVLSENDVELSLTEDSGRLQAQVTAPGSPLGNYVVRLIPDGPWAISFEQRTDASGTADVAALHAIVAPPRGRSYFVSLLAPSLFHDDSRQNMADDPAVQQPLRQGENVKAEQRVSSLTSPSGVSTGRKRLGSPLRYLAAAAVLMLAVGSIIRWWPAPNPLSDPSLRTITLTATRMNSSTLPSIAGDAPVLLELEISASTSVSEFRLRVRGEEQSGVAATTLRAEQRAPGVVVARLEPGRFPAGLLRLTLEAKEESGSAWTEVERYGLMLAPR